jgi:chorismate mutase
MDEVIDIDRARKTIDSLDLQIIDLIRRRRDVSHRIQRQRMREGGTRTVLARENVILAHYADKLGTGGTSLALNILGLCRGAIPESEAGNGARMDS